MSAKDEPSRIDLAFTRVSPYGTHPEPTYSGALSFLRRRYTKDLDGVDLAVVGVPYDLATTNRPGTRLGPRAIRAASASLAWCRPYAWDFDPFERAHVVDFGDVHFDPGRPQEAPGAIRAAFAAIAARGVAALALGGDHFISYPILQALHAVHGTLALIHFDAHSDTWADEDGRIDHGTMFFHAARQGLVDPARSIQVGMRTFNAESQGFHVLDARWLPPMGALLLVLMVAYFLLAAFNARIEIRGFRVEMPSLGMAIAQVLSSSLDWVIAAAVLYVLLPEHDPSFGAFSRWTTK